MSGVVSSFLRDGTCLAHSWRSQHCPTEVQTHASPYPWRRTVGPHIRVSRPFANSHSPNRFDAYEKAAEQFTISQAILKDPNTAAAEIDRVLTDCITSVCPFFSFPSEAGTHLLFPQARPVYLTLPTDLVYTKISSAQLRIPLSRSPPPNDPDVEKFVLDEIVKLVEAADNDAIFLVDACAIRHDVRDELDEMIRKTGFPVYSAPMGKTAVSEQYERYGGVSTPVFYFTS